MILYGRIIGFDTGMTKRVQDSAVFLLSEFVIAFMILADHSDKITLLCQDDTAGRFQVELENKGRY